jgi:hypothetical protein
VRALYDSVVRNVVTPTGRGVRLNGFQRRASHAVERLVQAKLG